MTQNAPTSTPRPENGYVWERCLNISGADHSVYMDHFNPKLLDVLAHTPRTLLDIGCGGGILGNVVKSPTMRRLF